MSDKPTRMTAKQWVMAEAMYESGDFTLEKIAEKFGVHKLTVHRHMKKKGVEKGARAEAVRERVEAKLEKEVEDEAMVLSRRIQETKEQHYILNAAITKRATREMVLADQEGRPISTAFNNLKALKMIAEISKTTRETQYEVLGITESGADDELPTLEVREMLDSEIAEIRNQQEKDAKAMGLLGGPDTDKDDA